MENPFLYFYSFISVSIELLQRYCILDYPIFGFIHAMCVYYLMSFVGTCEIFTGLEQLCNLYCLFAFLWLLAI